ncbi:MAG: hypothetical protein U0517_02125 [Candidatus Andersenbacteria bacterium]
MMAELLGVKPEEVPDRCMATFSEERYRESLHKQGLEPPSPETLSAWIEARKKVGT